MAQNRDKKHRVWVMVQQLLSRKAKESVLRKEAGLQIKCVKGFVCILRFALGLETNSVLTHFGSQTDPS